MSFFAAPALAAQLQDDFPQCLDGAPMLLQDPASACAAAWTPGWPCGIAEFDDAALMKAFGGEGRGVFMAPTMREAETQAQYGVRVIGRCAERVEELHALSVERRITPLRRGRHQRGAGRALRSGQTGRLSLT